MTNMKTVIISGANGYFGRIAQTYFKQQGWRVLTAARNTEADIYFDLDQPSQIAEARISQAADLFIHAAAAHEVGCRQDPYLSIFQNVAGTRAALEFCVNNQVPKFVYLSTFHVFGKPKGRVDEDVRPCPLNDYGLTNCLAEEYVTLYTRQGKLHGMNVRPSNFFGAPDSLENCRRWTLTPLAFCKEAVERKKIVLRTPGYQRRNFISIWDLCQVIQVASENIEAYPLINVAGPDTLSIRELAQQVRATMKDVLNQDIELILPEGEPTEEDFIYTSRYLKDIYQPQRRIGNFLADFCQLIDQRKALTV